MGPLQLILSIASFMCINSLNVVVFTDPHLNIVYDPYISSQSFCISWPMVKSYPVVNDTYAPDGRVVCNPPLNLMQTSADKIRNELKKYHGETIIFVPGDIVSHQTNELRDKNGDINKDFNQKMIEETIRVFFDQVESVKPNSKIFFTLGNNDNYEDYEPPLGKDLKSLYQFFKKYILSLSKTVLDTTIYDQTATYTAQVGDLLIINMNSNYFHTKLNKSEYDEGANMILDFVELKMNEIADNEYIKAMFNFHISVGIC